MSQRLIGSNKDQLKTVVLRPFYPPIAGASKLANLSYIIYAYKFINRCDDQVKYEVQLHVAKLSRDHGVKFESKL